MKKKHIIVGVLLIGGVLLLANYQLIFKSVMPPMPEIVSTSADGTSSKLFDYSIKIVGQVMNKGGDGYVVIRAYANQEGNTYEKSKQIYLLSYQTAEFEFVFDEVQLLKKNPTYQVETFPLGSLGN